MVCKNVLENFVSGKEVTASIQLCLVVWWHQWHPVGHNAHHTNGGEPQLFDFLTFWLSKRILVLWIFFLTFKGDFGSLKKKFYQIIYSRFGFVPVNLDLKAQIQICCLNILERACGWRISWLSKFHNFINTS